MQNYRLRGQWDIDDSRSLSFGVQRYIADMDLAGALSVADYKDGPAAVDPQARSFRRRQRPRLGHLYSIPRRHGPVRRRGIQLDQLRPAQLSQLCCRAALRAGCHADHPAGCSPRDFRVWGSEPRLSLGIDGDGVSQTWLLGARLVKEKRRLRCRPSEPEYRRHKRGARLGIRYQGPGRLCEQRNQAARRPPDPHPRRAL